MNMRLPLDAMVPSLLLASCISFTLVAAEIKLPDGPIIAAWQNWGACNDTQTIQAVERGVNVVFWFSSNLVKDGDKPKISGPLPDLECVARVRKAIKEKGLPTAHLLTIGGWDAPHPDTSFTGTEWFHAWNEWNQGLPMPFDGFDWDLEGNDDLTSPYNVFSPACLQLVVDMSAAAKAAGYLVTMAPPQTYFDSTMPYFNRYLNNSNPPDYHPEFRYRGRNSYAYMWAAAPPGTFDLVSVQLYETYAPAMQALQEGISGEEYLQSWAAQFILGWTINFNDTSLKLQGHVDVAVPASHFLIGLSFGSPPKSAFFWPETAGAAYHDAPASLRPRGYAFWNIALEDSLANHSNRSLSFASGLNSFLHVRKQRQAQLEKRSLRQQSNFFWFE
ncbi:Haloacid dehalogenase-like hydrolase domain-containing protein 3 [Durusdinium trenchii]|uniref:Haloacid dehalogenase-like hydrolase domain-containing protein 3 n=1 Tax=Durusdinium trenchii TaxID=1381693 RepID=A0ABP0RDU5_9DINO